MVAHSTAETMSPLLMPDPEGPVRERDRDSPGLLAELRGKTGKDGHWEQIRHGERNCRTGSTMTGLLSAMVWTSVHPRMRQRTLLQSKVAR